ncbi:MAG: M10 family metallopeptidase C-terminal domain-containing protein [Pseudomonadales bacterium]|nr:M10 family metallopeptidase C-terminal domain-containing protein [Pseudomonadales bacterium]
MAQLFTSDGESLDFSQLPGTHSVFGSSGAEVITASTSAEVTLDANVDKVVFPESLSNYLFQVIGTSIEIRTLEGQLLVDYLGLNNAVTLEFADQTLALDLTGLNQASLGTFTLATDTPTAVTEESPDTSAPTITSNQSFSLEEGSADETTDIVATVSATDDTAVTAFSIASGNDDGYFAIDNSGNITLTSAGLAGASNDFETTPNSFQLGIVASDAAGNDSSETAISISITDNTGDNGGSNLLTQAQAKSNIEATTGATPTSGQTNFVALENDSDSYWQTSQLTYSFNNTAPAEYDAEDKVGFIPFPDAAKDPVRDIFTALESFTSLNFTEVSSNGDIRFNAIDMSGGVDGFAYFPSNTAIGGDIFLNNEYTTTADYTAGTSSYTTAVHEIGHALGLDHSFEGNILTTSLDSLTYTVMSYTESRTLELVFTVNGNSISRSTNIDASPDTFMFLDIGALQAIYGANLNYNTGNDTYSLQFSDRKYLSIWDAGGTDTIDVSNTTGSSTIDLRSGQHSSVDTRTAAEQAAATIAEVGSQFSDFVNSQYAQFDVDTGDFGGIYTGENNLSIAQGAWIENVSTGSGDDTIQDNAVDNVISTGAGNDTIHLTEGGFDTVDGGAGTDTVIFDSASTTVATELQNDGSYVVVGADFGVQLTGVETLQFTDTSMSIA